MTVITLSMAGDIVRVHRQDVLVEHAQIGQLARLDRALDVFLAVLPGPSYGVHPDRFFNREALVGAVDRAGRLALRSTADWTPCSHEG